MWTEKLNKDTYFIIGDVALLSPEASIVVKLFDRAGNFVTSSEAVLFTCSDLVFASVRFADAAPGSYHLSLILTVGGVSTTFQILGFTLTGNGFDLLTSTSSDYNADDSDDEPGSKGVSGCSLSQHTPPTFSGLWIATLLTLGFLLRVSRSQQGKKL